MRPLEVSDAEAYARLLRDPEVVYWTGSDPRIGVDQAVELILDRGVPRWAIYLPDTQALLGVLSLRTVNDRTGSLSIKLAAEARGRGLATRAVAELIEWAFDEADFELLHWPAAVGNEPSRRLAERSGFRLDGTIRGQNRAGGERADGWIFSRHREDVVGEKMTEQNSQQHAAEATIAPVVPKLSDGVITLRGLELADAEQVAANCQDPAAQRWLPALPNPYTLQDAQTFIKDFAQAGWLNGERQTFAVADNASGNFIGTIDLHLFRASTAELGINIGPGARGSGTALRAVQVLVDYAFNGLNLQHLYWRAEVPNWASRKLAWKAGFRLEATLRSFGENKGEAVDMWLLSLASGEQGEPQEEWAGPVQPEPRL
nr:GNAT family N-acetyltransferase [Psychromicrobium silvestre]